MPGLSLVERLDSARFDRSVLLDLCDGDTSFLAEFVDQFVESSLQLEAELKVAAEHREVPRLERSAHSLRGMLVHLGPSTALDLADALEQLGLHNLWEVIGALASALIRELAAIRSELGQLRISAQTAKTPHSHVRAWS